MLDLIGRSSCKDEDQYPAKYWKGKKEYRQWYWVRCYIANWTLTFKIRLLEQTKRVFEENSRTINEKDSYEIIRCKLNWIKETINWTKENIRQTILKVEIQWIRNTWIGQGLKHCSKVYSSMCVSRAFLLVLCTVLHFSCPDIIDGYKHRMELETNEW
jgi:hypothetical protein